MNDIVKAQLEKLSDIPHTVDGVSRSDIPDKFDEIVFAKEIFDNGNKDDTVRVEF